MEKLATGLTVLILIYSFLVFITLLITGWYSGFNLNGLLNPVRSWVRNYRHRNLARSD